jgi:hypothetical protein
MIPFNKRLTRDGLFFGDLEIIYDGFETVFTPYAGVLHCQVHS